MRRQVVLIQIGQKQFQSTHPREGVRPVSPQELRPFRSFQSTHPREGVRRLISWSIDLVLAISIHAPPRRSATIHNPQPDKDNPEFQSTHPREGVRLS